MLEEVSFFNRIGCQKRDLETVLLGKEMEQKIEKEEKKLGQGRVNTIKQP